MTSEPQSSICNAGNQPSCAYVVLQPRLVTGPTVCCTYIRSCIDGSLHPAERDVSRKFRQVILLGPITDIVLRRFYVNTSAKSPGQVTSALPTPVFDEAFHLRSYRDAALYAAYNIKVCGGNARDLLALIDSKSYWETEALHYTALLHKYLDQITDLASYWQQEVARQKEVLTLRVSVASLKI